MCPLKPYFWMMGAVRIFFKAENLLAYLSLRALDYRFSGLCHILCVVEYKVQEVDAYGNVVYAFVSTALQGCQGAN